MLIKNSIIALALVALLSAGAARAKLNTRSRRLSNGFGKTGPKKSKGPGSPKSSKTDCSLPPFITYDVLPQHFELVGNGTSAGDMVFIQDAVAVDPHGYAVGTVYSRSILGIGGQSGDIVIMVDFTDRGSLIGETRRGTSDIGQDVPTGAVTGGTGCYGAAFGEATVIDVTDANNTGVLFTFKALLQDVEF